MKRILSILVLIVFSLASLAQENETALEKKLIEALSYVDSAILDEHFIANDIIIEQFRKNNYPEVIKYAKSYMQTRKRMLEQMYFVFSEQEREELSFMVEKDIVFHYIISAVIHTNDTHITGDIYDYLIFTKQLQLRTILQIDKAVQQSGNAKLLACQEEYKELKKQLANSNPSYSLNRDSLEHRMNILGRLLAFYGSSFIEKDNISWRNIQQRLRPGQSAIEFTEFQLFEGKEITRLDMNAAFIITPTCKQPILKLANSKSFLTYWTPDNQGDLYDAQKYGAALTQLFWLNILFFLDDEEIKTVYFSPSGVLHNIAIEHLPYDAENPVCWHYNMTRLSSTRELVTTHNHFPEKSAAIYGNLSYRLSAETMAQRGNTRGAVDPLPKTKVEIEGINQILSPLDYRVQTFTKQQGTEESVKSLDGHSPSILHFATHGFVDRSSNDVMQKSGLILSYGARAWEGKPIPKNTEDGILTAAEIAALDLSGTDIVVLSACNTALGEITTEGVWGLQRAFKQAGVQTIVMSLWQVDDESTAVLMQYFYEELMKGRRALDNIINICHGDPERAFDYTHDALHRAQHRMRQHPKYSNPYYWAGFIVLD